MTREIRAFPSVVVDGASLLALNLTCDLFPAFDRERKQ